MLMLNEMPNLIFRLEYAGNRMYVRGAKALALMLGCSVYDLQNLTRLWDGYPPFHYTAQNGRMGHYIDPPGILITPMHGVSAMPKEGLTDFRRLVNPHKEARTRDKAIKYRLTNSGGPI